jgi:hypothetical protein
MQQQQRPRDRVAQLQQMSGTSDFQQQGGSGDKPAQMGERYAAQLRELEQAERDRQPQPEGDR